MAKCRNCKKEIDANATRCPYCLTEMPTSDFIAKLKGAVIALILLGIFALAMYFFFINIGQSFISIGKTFTWIFKHTNTLLLVIDIFLWIISFLLVFLTIKSKNKKAQNMYAIIGIILLFSALILSFMMI